MHVKNHQFIHYLDDLRLKQNVPQGGYLLGFRSRETIFRNFLFALEAYTTTPDSFATYDSSNEKFYDFRTKESDENSGKQTGCTKVIGHETIVTGANL